MGCVYARFNTETIRAGTILRLCNASELIQASFQAFKTKPGQDRSTGLEHHHTNTTNTFSSLNVTDIRGTYQGRRSPVIQVEVEQAVPRTKLESV